MEPATQTQLEVHEARDAILARKLLQPQIGIVLGSGLSGLAEAAQHAATVPYSEIPHFPKTNAVGHAGKLSLGFLSGIPVVMLQGRSHRYEGKSTEAITFGVKCMQALGAETLIATNAAGGLNPRYLAGDLMIIDSHIDLLWSSRFNSVAMHSDSATSNSDSPRSMGLVPRGTQPYDFDLIRKCKKIAQSQGTTMHQGCYLATLGPTYETRNEYRMFRNFGADAVGMSTVPEVQTARALGMQVLAFSVITNVASTDIPQSTTHDEVVDTGNEAGPRLMRILQELLEDFAGCPD